MSAPRLRRQAAAAVVLLAMLACGWPARAEEAADAFARVVAEETELRSGPGIASRIVYVARRGETFVIDSRQGAGFWLKVILPDGRSGWVLGDAVQPVSVDASSGVDRPRRPGFFAPPPLATAHAGMAILGGVLDRNGYLELKPAIVLSPTLAFEPYLGMALTPDGKRLLYGGAFAVHLAPDWAVEPYLSLGLGGLSTYPNADQFVLQKETVWAARAGGGVLLALRSRILLRIEGANLTLFTEDSYRNVQSYAGGLGVYF